MKGRNFLVLLTVLSLCLVLSGPAQGEMYVEGYLGGSFAANAPDQLSGTWSRVGAAGVQTLEFPGHIDPAFQGGLKVGTWFVPEGFLGYNYPAWMKYLGFYLDFSYHRLNFGRQHGTNIVPGVANFTDSFFSEGQAATLAFMFALRYGFLPDEEVPFGRLQPYLAVGPAIFFSSQRPLLYSAVPWSYEADSDSSVNVALALEAGLRWMALKNVSLDASFKYRYVCPGYQYTGFDRNGMLMDLSFNPNLNLFSFQVGAAYHF